MHNNLKKSELLPARNSEQAIIFAFDIHWVLIKPNFLRIIVQTFKQLGPKAFILLSNYEFWFYMIADGGIPESVVDKLAIIYCKYGVTKKFLIQLINCQKINSELFGVINLLKRKNYKIFIASNIWLNLLTDLRSRFEIFDKTFDGYFFANYTKYLIEKPDSQYFSGLDQFLRKLNFSNYKAVFIDDKIVNIQAAKKADYLTIRYQNNKQVINQLLEYTK